MVLRYCLLNQSPQATGTRWYRTSTLAGVTVESKRVTSRGQKFTTSTKVRKSSQKITTPAANGIPAARFVTRDLQHSH